MALNFVKKHEAFLQVNWQRQAGMELYNMTEDPFENVSLDVNLATYPDGSSIAVDLYDEIADNGWSSYNTK